MSNSWDLAAADLWPGGELSAPEAAGLARVIQGFTQALTTADPDKCIAELERRMKK
jgi:hypothetical protein